MLSFTSSLVSDSEAFAIFVNDKFHFDDKKNVLSKETNSKINSYLNTLKDKKSEEEITSLDISGKQKCFIIKVKIATNIVANRTPRALLSIFLFKNTKKTTRFKTAPKLINFPRNPSRFAVCIAEIGSSPFPKSTEAKYRPAVLAINPTSNPINISFLTI